MLNETLENTVADDPALKERLLKLYEHLRGKEVEFITGPREAPLEYRKQVLETDDNISEFVIFHALKFLGNAKFQGEHNEDGDITGLKIMQGPRPTLQEALALVCDKLENF